MCCILVSHSPPACSFWNPLCWPLLYDLALCMSMVRPGRWCHVVLLLDSAYYTKQLQVYKMSPSLNIGALLPRRYFFYRKCGLASPINELLRKFLMRNKHATTKSGLTCCFEVGLSRVLFLIKTATTFAEQLLIHEHMLPPEQCGSQMTSSCTILQFVSIR